MSRKTGYCQAINEAIAEEMRRDSDVMVIGEDVRMSLMGQTAGLVEEFGKERVINTPVAEGAITGVAIGAAMNGLRPVLELALCDFAMLAMDQISNYLGQCHYVTGGQYSIPITIRTTVGGGFGWGFSHSQCLESQFMSVPGLILVEPSTTYDAKGLLKSAIRCDDPVVFFEHKKLLGGGMLGRGVEDEISEEDYSIPFGNAVIRKAGNDVTIVAFGYMVHEALEAARDLEQEGIDVEVIDPRTIVPLDKSTIFSSVEKTGRLVIVEEGRIRGSIGSDIAALACEHHLSLLKAPVKRVAAPMTPVPASRVLENLYLPGKQSIVSGVKGIL